MKLRATYFRPARSGFTLVEIAISLAIIGIALVAIIGVLPLGMTPARSATIAKPPSSIRTRRFLWKPSATARSATMI